MRIVYEYSHLGGHEILLLKKSFILEQIKEVIKTVSVGKTKISKEKNTIGKRLYSPIEMNKFFKEEFNKRDFFEVKDRYDIVLPDYSNIIKGSFKQVDFVKDRVFVEVQFGKYAFMFYDMAKFQYFYNEGKADVGIEIVPCSVLQKQMSTGVSYGEQLVYDIVRLRKHFPAVPVYILLIDM